MIVISGGIKGGSGKSTIATNLAVIRSAEGRDVLLIDADDQETSTDFTKGRNERRTDGAGYTSIQLYGAAVRTETLRLKAKYDDIIIDAGGRDTTSQRAALAVGDIYLIPFVPRSFDVWTLEKVAALLREMLPANPNLRALTFLNKADPRGQDNEDAASLLKEIDAWTFIDTPLGYRKAFGDAAGMGLAVTELRPQNPQAVEEIMILYRYLFDISMVSDKKAVGI